MTIKSFASLFEYFDRLKLQILFCLVWFVPNLCLGQKMVEVDLPSRELGEVRKIWISLPAHYELRHDKYHLVVLLDGDNSSLLNYTVSAKRYLEENAVDLSDYNTPEAILVGIEQKDRGKDFGKNAAQFLNFLSKEVLPYLTVNYRIENYKILIGHSLAGRFALYTFTHDFGLFNAVIAISPAYPESATPKVIVELDSVLHNGLKQDAAIYLFTTYLPNDQTEMQFRGFAEAFAAHSNSLKIPNFRFQFDTSSTLGHGKSPYLAVPKGLHFVYDPKYWQLNVDSLTDVHLDPLAVYYHYEQYLERRFGIRQPMGIYTGLIAGRLQRSGRIKEAIELLKARAADDPTDLYLFSKLLSLLKVTAAPEYKTNYDHFIAVMNACNTPIDDKKYYLHQIQESQ
jgi:predicted alpha/beta superfamily hydrolase